MAEPFRDRIEQRFEAWGRFVVARPIPVLLASLALAAACIAGLPRVYADLTFEAFLRKGDSVRVGYEAFRERFGRDERIIVTADPGASAGEPGVFTLPFLERLRSLHTEIEERVPHLVEVTSLVNARDTRGERDTLVVEDFLDPWPEEAADVAERRERALANPLFRNNVISPDGGVATLVLELELYSQLGRADDDLGGFNEAAFADADPPPFLTGKETAELVRVLHEVLETFETPDFRIHIAGSPVILDTLSGAMARDMPRFTGLALLSIGILLFMVFRRGVAVVVPMAVVALSVASTFGLMGWTGVPLHVPTQILPSVLLAVGIGDSVHLLSIFFERLRAGDDRAEALPHALGHSGLALVLTSVTTAGGIGSFATAGLEPVAMIGIFAPLGVMIALVLSLTLLPALLALAPLGSPRELATPSQAPNALDRTLHALGGFATRRPAVVLTGAALLTVVGGLGATRMELSHDPLSWLDPKSPLVDDTRFIDEHLGGAMSFEVLLQGAPEGLREPETLEALATLGHSFEQTPREGFVAGQTISLADVVKEINRALNANADSAYVIPADPLLVAQELLLFENTGSDDLEDLTDSQFEMGRMTVAMPWYDAVHYTPFFDRATEDIDVALGTFGEGSLTGLLALLVRGVTAVVTSMAESYVLALVVITPLMVLLLGNAKMGLLAMIPNTLPILMTLGLMGIFSLPLDAFTLMVGGIAIGVAVDDTIHFMHNYRRYRSRGMSLEDAVDTTLQTTGRAMLITTMVLSIGFLGFTLSSMVNLSNLGVLVAFAISMAFLADVLLAPALLTLVDSDRDAEGQTR